MATFDAVMIGAGVNTLAAATHLAARGWRVGVYEQAREPGGAVKSGAYTAPGFTHDWAAMNLSLFAGGGAHGAHAAELARHGCAFVPVARPFASVFGDGSWCGVSMDAAATRARIAALSQADAEAWDRLAAGFSEEAPHLLGLLGAPMTLPALARYGWKTLRAKGRAGMGQMLRFLAAAPRVWLEDTFEHPHVRAMLGAWGMHLDFAPDVAGGALFPYLEGMAGQAFGMVIGEGGAGTVTRAMVAAIEARGGKVVCNAPVARILHDNGRAGGIELADGQRIQAEKAVIAGVAPRALPGLTGATTPRFDRAMRGFVHAPGTMMIHLALDDLPAWPDPELRRFAYVHLAPSLDMMARVYQEAKAGLLPSEPILVVGQPTVFDPSRAPEGKHTLWVQVRMAPGTIQGDASGKIAATDWAEAAQPFADRALDILDGYAPGIRDRIIAQRVVSPTELEADNPNLVGGDQICGSHHLTQHFLFRPALGHADGTTPIRGLYLTGAAVWPGAGIGAGSGYLLAKKLVGK